jgi:carbon-monoxide dehydrogenase catalytic subunit
MPTISNLSKMLEQDGIHLDPGTLEMLKYSEEIGIETVFHIALKYNEKTQKFVESNHCPFGSSGVCCRQCNLGPCRIRNEAPALNSKPHNPSTNRGVCGATADTIVARNFLMMVSRGMAAHTAHAQHAATTLLLTATGNSNYSIKDEKRLRDLAAKLEITFKPTRLEKIKSFFGIKPPPPTIMMLAKRVAFAGLNDLRGRDTQRYMKFALYYYPLSEIEGLLNMGVLPSSSGEELLRVTHEVSMGVMSDLNSLMLEAMKMGIADSVAQIIATEIQDVLMGTPKLVESSIGFGSIKKESVNVIVHGHAPLLSHKIVELSKSEELKKAANDAGAQDVNIVGVCCTGNETLMRQGIAIAGSNLQQEMVIATGLADAMVVDYQCIYPSLTDVAEHFHTKVISTAKEGRMTGTLHFPFEEATANESAQKIIMEAINNFPKRKGKHFLPKAPTLNLIAGFSLQSCIDFLSRLDPADPLKPLVENIIDGNIRGVVLLAGCSSPKTQLDASHVIIARSLIADNILVVSTGCAAQTCARAGLLTSEATTEYAGESLRAVLTAIGSRSDIKKPLPPVWHFGSCVDNSRPVTLISAISSKLGIHIKKLPVAVSAAEWVTEKATAIGIGAVTLGLTVHLGVSPSILGGPEVIKILSEDVPRLTGGKFLLEDDPHTAAEALKDVISAKRESLGWKKGTIK